MSLAAKISGPLAEIAASLRKELQKFASDTTLYGTPTMEEAIDRQFRGERFHLMLVSVFAALAAMLAEVGIYGPIAFSVSAPASLDCAWLWVRCRYRSSVSRWLE
jgi:putative ABC transport system permease protein